MCSAHAWAGAGIATSAALPAPTPEDVSVRIDEAQDGQVVEVGTPEHFFENPQEDRTKLFLSQIL